MEHRLFKPATFEDGRETVVGTCNGFTMQQRWEAETPVFGRAILANLEPGDRTVLDYGVGVGRLAKEILSNNKDINVIGLDDSIEQRRLAEEYVDSERFITVAPEQLNQSVDLAYCIYVLQHVPAIALREAIQRMHFFLRPGGKLVYCSSDCRMAVCFGKPAFHDDRYLGVDIRREVTRLFEPIGPLFSEQELAQHEVVRKMVNGSGGSGAAAHPAIVYRRRECGEPYFKVAFAN